MARLSTTIPCMQSLLLAMLLVTSCLPIASRAETRSLATVPESGITVSLEGWAGIAPDSTAGRDAGFVPLVLTITNGSSSDRVWTVEPARAYGRGLGIVSVTQLAVPAGGVGRTTLYVDPGPSELNGFGGVSLNVRGYGLYGGAQQVEVERWNSRLPSGTSRPYFPAAISRTAFVNCRDGGLEQFEVVGQLDLTAAPEDWRGWSVFSRLLMDESEWIAMSAAQRKALLDWVALGGWAGVMVTDASAERLDQIGLPTRDADGRRRVGAGEVVPVIWDGNEISPETLTIFKNGSLHPRSDLLRNYGNSNQRGDFPGWSDNFRQLWFLFGPRQLPVVAIIVFLAVFGLIAGPLNLMVIAGPKRRARMFWTTPLISLLATLLLLGLIFFRDGVGGAGARRMLCLLLPEQNGMAIIQEQFSRTGVLLTSTFAMREPSWMRPLGDTASDAPLLEVDGTQRRGGWFTSRSDQGYLLQTVRPSRAKLELITGGDASPAVISSIDVPLERVFVIDEDGTHWTATDVGTGERKPLEPSDAQAFTRWYRDTTVDAGSIRKVAFDAVQSRRGYAYAEAVAAAAEVAITTLPSIRWIDERAVFIGPVTRTAAP